MAYVNDFGDSVAINMSHQQMKDLGTLLDKVGNAKLLGKIEVTCTPEQKENYQKLFYAINNHEYETNEQ